MNIRVNFAEELPEPFVFLDELDDPVMRGYLEATIPVEEIFIVQRCAKGSCGKYAAANLSCISNLLSKVRIRKIQEDKKIIENFTKSIDASIKKITD